MATPAPIRSSKSPKVLPQAVLQRQRILAPIAAVMFVIAALLQGSNLFGLSIDQLHKQYEPKQNAKAIGGLNNEFLLLPLLGFREAAAGLLWVRCDEFFHSGDYDAILPLVRVITWLDPHADNVYVTGAWHLAYNFTDSSERSDRRYIAPSEALLDEGIANNDFIPDIKFEKGWENYDKIKDYPMAESAFKDAINTKPNKSSDDYPYGAPLKVLHILAHTYEKEGRIPEAIAEWQAAIDRSDQVLKGSKNDFSDKMLNAAEKHNRDETMVRYHDRYLSTGHSKNNPSNYPGIEWPFKGSSKPGPWDVSFQPKIEVKRPKVLTISGLFNAADGARIDVRITDWDYTPHVAQGSSAFAVDPDQTILVDSIAVRKNAFEREIDMSKDPKMYSFSHDTYRIVLGYNTRSTSPHLTDRFGWNGEGITDNNPAHIYVDKDPGKSGTRLIDNPDGSGPLWDGHTLPAVDPKTNIMAPDMPHGQQPRLIRVTYKVTKAQLEGNKPITDADIVPNE